MRTRLLIIILFPTLCFGQSTKYDSIVDCLVSTDKINLFGEKHIMIQNFFIEEAIFNKYKCGKKRIIIFDECKHSELFMFLNIVEQRDSNTIINSTGFTDWKEKQMMRYRAIVNGMDLEIVPIDVEDDTKFLSSALRVLLEKYQLTNNKKVEELYKVAMELKQTKPKRCLPLLNEIIKHSEDVLNNNILNDFDRYWLLKIIDGIKDSKDFICFPEEEQFPYREEIMYENFVKATQQYYSASDDRIIYGFWGLAHVTQIRLLKNQKFDSMMSKLKSLPDISTKINTIGIMYHLNHKGYRKLLRKLILDKEAYSYIYKNIKELNCIDFPYKRYFDKIIYTD